MGARLSSSQEGDLSNAGYWYQRAGKLPASMSLDTEWAEIVNMLLGEHDHSR